MLFINNFHASTKENGAFLIEVVLHFLFDGVFSRKLSTSSVFPPLFKQIKFKDGKYGRSCVLGISCQY